MTDHSSVTNDNAREAETNEPILTTTGAGVILAVLGFIAFCAIFAYGMNRLADLYPERPEVRFEASDIPNDTLKSLPDIREAFLSTPECHRKITGTATRSRYINVNGDAYAVILFSPVRKEETKTKSSSVEDDMFLVLFSKYDDVFPDILGIDEVESAPLTIETDGVYFTFPEY